MRNCKAPSGRKASRCPPHATARRRGVASSGGCHSTTPCTTSLTNPVYDGAYAFGRTMSKASSRTPAFSHLYYRSWAPRDSSAERKPPSVFGSKSRASHWCFGQRPSRSRPVFAIRWDVGDQSVFEGNFLDFAGHVPQIHQQTIHLCHPHQRILLGQARERPLGIERVGPNRLFDGACLARKEG
jgi:hypothetical protein